MTGKVIRQARITRAEVQANPRRFYVFGDNMLRRGLGGQAKEMRGEPNTIGVPTKWNPSTVDDAYFTDDSWRDPKVRKSILTAFMLIEAQLATGWDVVIPADGLGTGLAQLPARAPAINAYIEARIREIEALYAPASPEESEREKGDGDAARRELG